MFFRRPNKNKLESREQSNCEDILALLKTRADEKCRSRKKETAFNNTNYDKFIWNEKECAKASQDVVDQIERCLNHYQRKGHTG